MFIEELPLSLETRSPTVETVLIGLSPLLLSSPPRRDSHGMVYHGLPRVLIILQTIRSTVVMASTGPMVQGHPLHKEVMMWRGEVPIGLQEDRIQMI